MSLYKHLLQFAVCSLALAIAPTHAEQVRIPVGEQAKAQSSVDMPTRGMTKHRVQELFGEPLERVAPTGEPPISRWLYPDFTVYFDQDVVIHSVRAFKSDNSSAR